MAQFSFKDYELNSNNQKRQQQSVNTNYVSYFSLKNDGDEAIVRFVYSSPDQFNLTSTHEVKINGKNRKVGCLRTPWDEVDKCPLCASGNKPMTKFFVKMIEYVRDENGKITVVPRIWERPRTFAATLEGYFEEYGDLSECVFKIKRNGAAGSTSTTYTPVYCNPTIYNKELYVKDFSAFDNYNLSSFMVLDKSYEELKTYLNTGVMPMPEKQNNQQRNQQQNGWNNYQQPSVSQQYQQPVQQTVPNNVGEINLNTPADIVESHPQTQQQENQQQGFPTDNTRPKRTYTY